MLLNDCKAGMQDIDKIRIESIIRQNTGTNYYSHQQKKQQRIDERIDRNRQLLATTTVDQLAIAERKVEYCIFSYHYVVSADGYARRSTRNITRYVTNNCSRRYGRILCSS